MFSWPFSLPFRALKHLCRSKPFVTISSPCLSFFLFLSSLSLSLCILLSSLIRPALFKLSLVRISSFPFPVLLLHFYEKKTLFLSHPVDSFISGGRQVTALNEASDSAGRGRGGVRGWRTGDMEQGHAPPHPRREDEADGQGRAHRHRCHQHHRYDIWVTSIIWPFLPLASKRRTCQCNRNQTLIKVLWVWFLIWSSIRQTSGTNRQAKCPTPPLINPQWLIKWRKTVIHRENNCFLSVMGVCLFSCTTVDILPFNFASRRLTFTFFYPCVREHLCVKIFDSLVKGQGISLT